MLKKSLLKALFFVFVVLLGYELFFAQRSAKEKSKNFVGVEVTQIKKDRIASVLESIGTAVSNESVDITSNVTQIVEKVNFSDCDQVKKGQLLVRLNVDKKLKELSQLEINLKEQEREFKRLARLRGRNVIAERDYDMQESKFLHAKAQVEELKAEIKESSITAPFDGFLGIRNVSVGTLVSPGTIITTLDDIKKIKVDFSVPEKYVLSIKAGTKIQAESSAAQDKKFEGNVIAIVPRISTFSRNVMVRAIIENDDYILKPGMMLKVKVNLNDREVILVSEKCVANIGEKHFVYTIEKLAQHALIKKRFIEIGERQNGLIEVISGISEGDMLVFEGINKLSDGDMVEILNFKDFQNPSLSEPEQKNASL